MSIGVNDVGRWHAWHGTNQRTGAFYPSIAPFQHQN